MALAVGSYCPVCHKVMEAGEDLVVCPECGATYHRDCYLAQGKCLFADLHGTDNVYTPEYPDPPAVEAAAPEMTTCPRCGVRLLGENSAFCPACGAMMHPPAEGEAEQPETPPIPLNPFANPLGGLEPEADLGDGHKAHEYMAYVRENSFYFLPRFAHFHRKQSVFDFNFSAAILCPLWFFYRRMYLVGTLGMLGMVIANLPSFFSIFHFLITGQEFENTALLQLFATLGMTLSYGLRILSGLFANRLYYHHCKNEIGRWKETLPPQATISACDSLLASKGGVSMASVFLSMGILMSVCCFLTGALCMVYPQILTNYPQLLQELQDSMYYMSL